MMQKKIRGKAFVIGDDIDTDQIIPARFLSYNPAIPAERRMFGKFALSGLPNGKQGLPSGTVPFVKEDADQSEYKIIIAGKNFGCGSSREHASICLKESGIEAVAALFYSRIFFRNSVNGGYLIPFESMNDLTSKIKTGDDVEIDVEKNILINHSLMVEMRDGSLQKKIAVDTMGTHNLKPLGDILPIIECGNVFEYAKKVGMIKIGIDEKKHTVPDEPEKD